VHGWKPRNSPESPPQWHAREAPEVLRRVVATISDPTLRRDLGLALDYLDAPHGAKAAVARDAGLTTRTMRNKVARLQAEVAKRGAELDPDR
jgi:hypothetical protein